MTYPPKQLYAQKVLQVGNFNPLALSGALKYFNSREFY